MTMLWPVKNKSKLYHCSLLCINLISILRRPADPTAINAVLAIIADGGRAIVVIDIEPVEIFFSLFY